MLTFVGLGLYSEMDITLIGKKAIENADIVFAEFYTSRLVGTSITRLENFFGKHITVLHREDVENGEQILKEAKNRNVVLIVAGDAMIATTHVSLRLMAEREGIATRVVHNASIVTAVPGLLGLQQYKFGRTVSLPFPQENYFPTSPYDFILENFRRGLHTLILLDINPWPMTASEAMLLLLKMEKKKKENLIQDKTLIAVVARAGAPDCLVRAGYFEDMIRMNFGPPLHSLVIPGNLHFTEAEAMVRLAGAPEKVIKN